jgi:hypothetical protein
MLVLDVLFENNLHGNLPISPSVLSDSSNTGRYPYAKTIYLG